MPYRVKEIYYTLQGEGAHTGRPAVFLRFAGCNLWSGREKDRASAICQFCDTDFVGTDGPGGGQFATADKLAEAVAHAWPDTDTDTRFTVCTGGEPLLQLDAPLLDALHAHGFTVAVETNGTKPLPDPTPERPGVDWVTVSPKANAPLHLTTGDELKLVYPQDDLKPEHVEHLDFTHFYLQPMDGPNAAANTEKTIAYCKTHPKWRLSLQTHKLMGIP